MPIGGRQAVFAENSRAGLQLKLHAGHWRGIVAQGRIAEPRVVARRRELCHNLRGPQHIGPTVVARQSQRLQPRGDCRDGKRNDCLRPQASAVEEASTSKEEEEAPIVFPWQGRGELAGGNGRGGLAGGNGSHGTSTSHDHTAALETLKQKGVRVRVKDLRKVFEMGDSNFVAADGINIDIPAGTITALVGPSGSGKTTLLRMIAGLNQADSGHIFFDDEEATNLPVQDRHIGFVFQSFALFNHMTVGENVRFGMKMRKLPIDVVARTKELLDIVELGDFENRWPAAMSGGQRQRVALVRALAAEPRLLLLDEPFGALDPRIRGELRRELRSLINRIGITAIFVTHDQEEAFEISDNVAIFNKGQVQQFASPSEIESRPANPFVLNFISDVNRVPSDCEFVQRMGLTTEKPLVMFRPTRIQLAQGLPPIDGPLFSPATVVERNDSGFNTKYVLRFDDGVAFERHLIGERMRVKKSPVLKVGERVYVRVDPSELMPYSPEDIETGL